MLTFCGPISNLFGNVILWVEVTASSSSRQTLSRLRIHVQVYWKPYAAFLWPSGMVAHSFVDTFVLETVMKTLDDNTGAFCDGNGEISQPALIPGSPPALMGHK